MRNHIRRILCLLLVLLTALLLTACATTQSRYEKAQKLLANGEYAAAAEVFSELGSYEDATTLTMYSRACAAAEAGDYLTAITTLESMGDYKDCPLRVTYYTARAYEDKAGTDDWVLMLEAQEIYRTIPLFMDSQTRISALDGRVAAAKAAQYDAAVTAGESGRYSTAISAFRRLGSYQDSRQRITYYGIREDEDALAGSTDQDAIIATASRYANMGAYLDCPDRAAAMTAQADKVVADKYARVDALIAQGKYDDATALLNCFGNYGYDKKIFTYTTIREDEATLTNTTDQDALIAVANRYADMGAYLDCPDRAAVMTAQADKVVADKYAQADMYITEGEYDKATSLLSCFGSYGSAQVPAKCYAIGEYTLVAGRYDEAISAFKHAGSYSDAPTKLTYATIRRDESALEDSTDQDKIIAVAKRYSNLGDYLDCSDRAAAMTSRANQIVTDKYAQVDAYTAEGKYDKATSLLSHFGNYGNDQVPAKYYALAEQALAAGEYDTATTAYKNAGGYSDARASIPYTALRKDEAALVDSTDPDALVAMAKRYADTRGFRDCAARAADLTARADKIVAEKYAQVDSYIAEGKYDKATSLLSHFSSYGSEQIPAMYYSMGEHAASAGNYDIAISAYRAAGDYSGALYNVSSLMPMFSSRISAGGSHTVGLRADGSVVAVGNNFYGQCNVSGWSNIVAISAGSSHTVGLRADGSVIAVGNNRYGQCDVSGWSDIIAISARSHHTVGLRADGTVVAVGDNSDGQCKVSSWSNIVAISAGGNHTVGLRADGTVVAVGNNRYRQCNVSGWQNVKAISAGTNHTIGLSNGFFIAIGNTFHGQCDIPRGKGIVIVSAADTHTICLCSDGSVTYAGVGKGIVSHWSDIIAISAGGSHTVGLRTDGTVVAVGNNDDGQCNVSRWNLFD